MASHQSLGNDPGEGESFRAPQLLIRQSPNLNSRWKLPRRYAQAMLGFLCFFIIFWMRSSYSVAILNEGVFGGHDFQKVEWTETEASVVAYSFSWAYAAAQIPAALLVNAFSGRKMLSAVSGSFSIAHIILFFVFPNHLTGVIIVRVLQGLAMAGLYSATIEIWRHWAAPSERTTLLVIMLSGEYFGKYLGVFLCSMFMNAVDERFNCIFGAVGLLCCALWTTLTSEKPSSHQSITQSELAFLEESLKHDDKSKITLKTIPWLRISTSLPVIALCLISICYDWCSYLIFKYSLVAYSKLTHVIIALHIGASVPEYIVAIMILIGGCVADVILYKSRCSLTRIRKGFCSGGLIVTAALVLVVSFEIEIVWGIVVVIFASVFLGLVLSGFFVNALDLSPQYGSLVIAYCTMCGTVANIALSYVMERILNNYDGNNLRWWCVGTSILCFVGGAVYALLGSAEKQSWSDSFLPEYNCRFNAYDATLNPSGIQENDALEHEK